MLRGTVKPNKTNIIIADLFNRVSELTIENQKLKEEIERREHDNKSERN